MSNSQSWKLGMTARIGIMVGVGLLMVTMISLFSIYTGKNLSLRIYGTSTALPTGLDECYLMGASGIIILAGSIFSSFMWHKIKIKQTIQGKLLLLISSLAIVIGLGRAIQLQVLKASYGSMAAWYAADNQYELLKVELEKGQTEDVLDDVMYRALQYKNAKIFALALDFDAKPFIRYAGGKKCGLEGQPEDVLKEAKIRGWNFDCTKI